MATMKDWLEGARVRTLPASLAPVIIGAGMAFALNSFSWVMTLLAALVALCFQIGSNFSNDYSDGVRGTDEYRVGPPRLTAGGKVKPQTVKLLAWSFFGLACVFGLILVALSGKWWLLLAGVAAVLAAWFYTGGKHPYGYMGLGELFVLAFFGYMATIGTLYTQAGIAPLIAWIAATGVGLVACALLMVNNIRDIPTDLEAGKLTLAVRLGERRARWSYYWLLAIAVALSAALSVFGFGILNAMLVFLIPVVFLARPVLRGAQGNELLPTLRNTGIFELCYAVAICAGMVATTVWPGVYWRVIGWSIVLAGLVIAAVLMFVSMRRRGEAK